MPVRNPFKKKNRKIDSDESMNRNTTPVTESPPWMTSSSTATDGYQLHGGGDVNANNTLSNNHDHTHTTVGSSAQLTPSQRGPTPDTFHNNVRSFDIEQNLKDDGENSSRNDMTMEKQHPQKQLDDEVTDDYNLVIDGKPVYIVKQKRGYLSMGFSIIQTVIMIAMMVQCSIAPLKINPMIGPYPDALSYWGGKNAYDILYDHEYWRLFTPIMLHAGIFHLLCNIAVQLDTGAFFEREWGSIIWLTVYLGSAAAGSILSVIVTPNSVGVGSSGSVCGLFGAKIAEALCRSRESTKTNQKELSHAILCEQFGSTLCSVVLILVFSFIPYVDWAAHVGGLLGGFVVGLMLFVSINIIAWPIAYPAKYLLAQVYLLFYTHQSRHGKLKPSSGNGVSLYLDW